ncbi:hypothetical protein [Paraburkholderia sp. Ac-20342]|uniref:hypothetical protein n=1 Tax=Paraburkholderia sp. Ac-20342 TaxID=2703889 RepID=UPI00197E35EA|nr:hypothetical protein [Paraburkholderia sp. Ac-20342]
MEVVHVFIRRARSGGRAVPETREAHQVRQFRGVDARHVLDRSDAKRTAQIPRGVALGSARHHGIPEYLAAHLEGLLRRLQCPALLDPANYRQKVRGIYLADWAHPEIRVHLAVKLIADAASMVLAPSVALIPDPFFRDDGEEVLRADSLLTPSLRPVLSRIDTVEQ